MITQVVGNAHIFYVVHDMESNEDYGVHVEVSAPAFEFNYKYADDLSPTFFAEGNFVKRELIKLEDMPEKLQNPHFLHVL